MRFLAIKRKEVGNGKRDFIYCSLFLSVLTNSSSSESNDKEYLLQ